MVTGTFQDVIVMTALSDCIALKAPAKSGDWEFINTTLAGSTFKVHVTLYSKTYTCMYHYYDKTTYV